MDDFLREFHQRRREEAMEERSFGTWLKRLGAWFREPGVAKWAYGAGIAYAAVLIALLAMPQSPPQALPETRPVDHRVIEPAPPLEETMPDKASEDEESDKPEGREY